MNPRSNPNRAARREPSVGRFDELQFRESRSSGLGRRVKGWNWRWIGVGVAVLVVLALLLRQPLSDRLWPQTRAERLREEATHALATGRLTAADGSGARELYEAALALDPDRSDAREGLNRVGQAALTQALQAMAHQQFAQAHQALTLAEELSVPRAQIDALREQLRQHEAASVGIDELLQQADAARAAGRLDGEGGALPLYLRVLELAPHQTRALEGREDTLSDLLQQARADLAKGDVAAAAALVQRVQAADAGHVELPDALAELGRGAEQRRKRAERELHEDKLALALEGFNAALLVNAQDAEAQRGVQSVAIAHARSSERLSADYRFAEAEAELREAEAIAGSAVTDLPAIAEAQQHLTRARQSQRQATGTLPVAQRQKRVAQLLAEAAQAQARGDLLTPPGDSAYDKLRAARAIAPQDGRVKAASARLAPAASACFREALRVNRLIKAGGCLDARRTLEGDSSSVREDRRELAQRWIAMGDQRLGAGEVEGAQAALEAARALDARAEGLAAFAERVRAATLAAGKSERKP